MHELGLYTVIGPSHVNMINIYIYNVVTTDDVCHN